MQDEKNNSNFSTYTYSDGVHVKPDMRSHAYRVASTVSSAVPIVHMFLGDPFGEVVHFRRFRIESYASGFGFRHLADAIWW